MTERVEGRAIVNVEMAAAWDGDEGEHWAAHADRFEAIGPLYDEALLAAASLGPGDSVLDVGCGTGGTARAAARIASGGNVLGVDLSTPMLEAARARAERDGVHNIVFQRADAQVHDLGRGLFDVAISSFGAMFFNDPTAAFSNTRTSLRADGRLALLAWRNLAENEWLCEIRAALATGRTLPSPPAGMPGPFGLADRDATWAILDDAGYATVAIEAFDAPLVFGADRDDAFEFVSTLGMVRGLLHGLDEGAARQASQKLRDMLEAHASSAGVAMGGAAWLITATANDFDRA